MPIDAFLSERRDRLATAWGLEDEIVLVGAGEPVHYPGGADQTYPFRAHAEYFYLADQEVPGAVMAFDPASGWRSFAPEVTQRERVWEGNPARSGEPLTGLAPWLLERRGRTVVMLGAELPGVVGDRNRVPELREAYLHVRRTKDAAEIDRIRRAVVATAAGFEAARAAIRPGATEREVQIEIEAAFGRGGGDRPGYETIVGTGSNSAVLHFMPGTRVVEDGALVLVDAAAEVRRYLCDVTRTFAAGGTFTAFQRELYDVVLRTCDNAIAACRAGVEYRDVHMAACCDIADGLVRMGILKGRPDDLVEQDAQALFFPHGIGHMVGFGVRDASGYLPGRKPSNRPGLVSLRTDLPLEPGYVVTIEPGVYFIPALLQDAKNRQRHRDTVAWDRVDKLLDAGGVRIEDNVLVTKNGPENLTAAIPRLR